MARRKPQLYRFDKMPRETVMGGRLERAAVRSDSAIVTLNWFRPGSPRVEPHNHPFDQLSFIFSGTLIFEVDGEQIEAGPGTVLRIPPGAMHTAWPKGDEVVLNVDVFAPIRSDYLFLTAHQGDEFPDAAVRADKRTRGGKQ
jgi:quercetin dioxygenase-like cupin family protein